MAPRAWQRAVIAVFLALIAAWYLATLRPGAPWGDDWAMYVLQARNIAEGHWFGPTGYIYNPHVPKIGPPSYPPLFPVLLAPLYSVWKLNLTPMKVEVILLFLAALYLIFEYTARQVPFPFAAGIVAAIGLSPSFWDMKEAVNSDVPFLFFAMLALCVIAACERRQWKSTGLAVSAAVCVYLAFATRTIGVALLAPLAIAAMPRWAVFRRKAIGIAVLAVFLIGIHSLIFRGAGSYLVQLHAPWQELPHNLLAYFWNLRNVYFGLGGGIFAWLFLLVIIAAGFAGLAIRLRQRISPTEAFTLAYALIVLLWSTDEDLRLLFPLLPLWFLYITVALRRLPSRVAVIAGVALLGTATIGFASRYSQLDKGPIHAGIGDPAFLRVCRYISEDTRPDSIFVFTKARLLALATRRSTAPYHHPATDAELWQYFRAIGARYVLVHRDFEEDRDYLEPLLQRDRSAAQLIYGIGGLQLYRLRW